MIKPLDISLINTEAGRYLLSTLGAKPIYPIVKITPNSFVEKLDRKTFRATFFSRRPIEQLFAPIIEKIEIANDEWKPIINTHEAFLHYAGLEPKNSIYPQIFLTVSTFNPDANPETTSVDGYVERAGVDETFGTIRGGAGTGSGDTSGSGGGIPRLNATATSNQYSTLIRGIFLFDTSVLSANAIISAATLSLYVDGGADQFSASINFTSCSPASNTALVSADFNNTVGSTKFANDKTIVDLVSPLNAYEDWTLNASGIAAIDKTGITKFMSRFSVDIEAGTPTWISGGSSFITPHFAEGANKPKLVVTYILPPGAGENYAYLM